MKALAWLKAPLWAAAIFGPGKSFRHNPILGSPRLNEMGLHRRRVEIAAVLADRRRRALAASVPAEDREAFDRDGFLVKHDFLPPEAFARLSERLHGQLFEAREWRRGPTVTRMIPLTARTLGGVPEARTLIDDPVVTAIMRYVASTGGRPVYHLRTVIAEPSRRGTDARPHLHSDGFFPTARCWLFLHDVGEEDAPLLYAPGSHRVTPERIEWEYRMSLAATADKRAPPAVGPFRVTPEQFEAFDYQPARPIVVPANTLVYIDTYGFHARARSAKPTLRMEIHGYLRRNPFVPWIGLDPLALPAVGDRQLDLYLDWCDLRERMSGRKNVWRAVGAVTPDSPPHV